MNSIPDLTLNKCKCGCGITIGYGRKYVHGHNRKGVCKALATEPIVQPNGCWELNCGKTAAGYTTFWVEGIQVYGHVYFYEKYKGTVPPLKVLDHICENRGCVNPDHLQILGRGENMTLGRIGRDGRPHLR